MAPANISVADFFGYEQRSKTFAAGKAELKENLLRIDKCCEELQSAVDFVVGKLLDFRQRTIAELQTWRATLSADIDAAVAEVENSLAKENVQLHSKYSEQLRSFHEGSLILFRYTVSTNWLEASLQELFCTEFMSARPLQDIVPQTFGRHSHDVEIPTEVVLRPRASSEPFESSPSHFVQLSKQQVRFFSYRLNSWEPAMPLRQPILFDSRTTFTLLRSNYVFACGNSCGTHKEAYCIELCANQGEVHNLPSLIHQRGASGLALDLDRVFVFGSRWAEGEKSVEVLSDGAWSLLSGSMTCGRWYFTPCVQARKAYLCTGDDTTIDVLDFATLAFLPSLHVVLPEEETVDTVCVMVGDALTIISRNFSTCVEIAALSVSTERHQETELWPVSVPVICGGWIYWVRHDGRCMRAFGTRIEIF